LGEGKAPLMADEKTAAKASAGDMDDLLSRAREVYTRCESAEQENRARALDDIKFARLGEQWDAKIKKEREDEGRPCLTINRMPTFIRQVVNDARQNKPQPKTHPVDSNADPETAKVIDGLIRNIEYTSNADAAYDTGIDCSVSSGIGYWRVGLDYAYDDTFDMDLKIIRVANQFSVYGDPNSTAVDSSDWNDAFVVDRISKDEYARRYKGKKNYADEDACVDFSSDAWSEADQWMNEDGVLIAEWWHREEVEKTVYLLSDGAVVSEITPETQALIDSKILKIDDQRVTKSHKVTQTILSGAEVLDRRDWPGKYIPIIPVYGDEVVVEGKRHFFSLIHFGKDPQRMFNAWRSAATEIAGITPRVPYIGKAEAFASDADRWATANTKNHPYLIYDGDQAPQRQPLDTGPAASALQEAMNASDDMKSVIGLYDASLGAQSNETSGVAINARDRQGDTSTFHFIDNLTRAIRHTGIVLIDLIPKVYTTPRIIRIIGEDGSESAQHINQEYPQVDENGQPMMEPVTGPDGQPMMHPDGQTPMMKAIMAMRDLRVGKYDLTVSAGPSYTTRRQESVTAMTELMRSYPPSAPIVAPAIAKNSDWPGADEIAEGFKKLEEGQVPPELQKQMEQMAKENEDLKKKLAEAEMQQAADTREIEAKAQAEMAQLAQKEKLEIRKQDIEHSLAMRELQMKRQLQEQEMRDKATLEAMKSMPVVPMMPPPQIPVATPPAF
jgi:hypothetical protein